MTGQGMRRAYTATRLRAGAAAWGIVTHPNPQPGLPVAKPNYAFEKRQRELEKKRKKEEKAQKKSVGHPQPPGGDDASAAEPSPPGTPPAP